MVLIDNGHGLETPGKRSPDSRLFEYKYTREIAKMLHQKLTDLGIKSVLLVPEESDISLSERCNRANKYYDEDKSSILISIHCNAAGSGEWMNARGWEAWTSIGQTKSDILADYLYKAAIKHLTGITPIRSEGRNGDNYINREKNFTILFKTRCPSVLTENLFQDNKLDVKYLLSDEGKQTIVNLHVDGIVNYLNSQK